MAEQLRPQQVNNHAPYGWSRRDFLRGAGAAAASMALLPLETACTLSPAKREGAFRREKGVWSQSEIEQAAAAMMEDRRFKAVSFAGRILQGNQRGESVLSATVPIFNDKRIRVATIDAISTPYKSPVLEKSAPMGAYITQEPPIVITTLQPKTGSKFEPRTIKGGSSLAIEEIQVSSSSMQERSDIVFKFFLAKEIYNAHAFQIIASKSLRELSDYYDIPDNELIRRAVQASIVDIKTSDGVPLAAMADILAHFYLIADYKKADDLGLLTEKDKKAFGFIGAAAKLMEDTGFLIKDPQGNYQWTEEGARLENLWINAAYTAYKVFFEK